MTLTVQIIGVLSLAYFVAQSVFSLGFLGVAWRDVTRYLRRPERTAIDHALSSPLTPAVSLIVPAYNEEMGIVASVQSLLGLRYPDLTVIVVNDGSSDATLQRLIDAFELVPIRREQRSTLATAPVRAVYGSPRTRELVVIDKENGGKADALNAGLNAARTDYFCAVDADAVLESDALIRVAGPILDDPDHVVATGGIVRIANGCRMEHGRVTDARLPTSKLAGIQTVEYIRAFLIGRVGWSKLRSLLIISGAFGFFRRDLVEKIGGYLTDTVGEDMELVVRLHRHLRHNHPHYRIEFVPDPVCWTEVPETIRVLGRQRRRWQAGLTETLWRHRVMAANPRYGRIGTLAFPYYVIFELLGPVIELLSYAVVPLAAATGLLSPAFLIAYMIVSLLLGLVISIAALTLEEFGFHRLRGAEVRRLIGLAALETFGYRQVLAWYRVMGIVDVLRRKTAWGAMPRVGLGAGVPDATAARVSS
jgi:cellulose synthase/poly-beta-1,6-N-acetylglucosamine synthase-like glycosyltransferase